MPIALVIHHQPALLYGPDTDFLILELSTPAHPGPARLTHPFPGPQQLISACDGATTTVLAHRNSGVTQGGAQPSLHIDRAVRCADPRPADESQRARNFSDALKTYRDLVQRLPSGSPNDLPLHCIESLSAFCFAFSALPIAKET
ncbi:unnamed protein product [Clonostachys chloroleuca]|uniref:Uncharacterized protein n=1 Tax=Clonostachys chloroleuca TaxID=1926264 RepID=A0AA35LY32_9HYPO|nr:unnamed protein product [Clonostachys chloroleuca]